jgi:hypothetical protein
MNNIPKKIYLQHGLTKAEMKETDYNELIQLTFCNHRINKHDLEYELVKTKK